ncbi:hypothetical protein BXZ70DRAFT_973311, partial [Cristinia sonorae]
MAEIQLRQHRTFVFSFYIYRSTACLMRWDRVGAIVSEPIDLETESPKFYEFFYRLGAATDLQLGFDPTAIVLYKDVEADADVIALRHAVAEIPPESRIHPYISKAFEGDRWPFYRLSVPDRDDATKSRTFLVRNLSSHSISPTGRATKGYIAFDTDTKEFRFLKNAWRPQSKDIPVELDVYRDLERNNVQGTATVCCGGDLPSQTTKTDKLTKDYLQRVHTRLVLNEVGMPLKDYLCSRELCTAVLDAYQAHDDAWTKAGILHRDISEGNIVLFVNPITGVVEGLLIDWDLCKYRSKLRDGPTQKSRSGTWRFLSAALVNFLLKGNEVSDDIESFFHLLVLFALRFHCPHLDTEDVKGVLTGVYDKSSIRKGFWIGSLSKLQSVCAGTLPFVMKPNSPLASLLDALIAICKEHYASLDLDDLAKRYGIPEDPENGPSGVGAPPPDLPRIPLTKYQRYATAPEPIPEVPQVAASKHHPLLNDHKAFGEALFR